jgi:hypothetical protein
MTVELCELGERRNIHLNHLQFFLEIGLVKRPVLTEAGVIDFGKSLDGPSIACLRPWAIAWSPPKARRCPLRLPAWSLVHGLASLWLDDPLSDQKFGQEFGRKEIEVRSDRANRRIRKSHEYQEEKSLIE